MFPVPFNDRHRLRALASYGVLDTAPEEAFDSLTRIARRTFNLPIAMVSLVDADRQWFKSRAGLDAAETPRNVAFCAHAIAGDETLVVPDARADARFRDNPLVAGASGIRFYAGAPLITAEGFRLGTFCIIDRAPRPDFEAAEVATLEDFARATMRLLDLRRVQQAAGGPEREASAAHDAREDLFALVAHEIRSPIASLIGVARAMEARAFGPLSDPRYESYVTALKDTAEQVGRTTDRMLDFARLGGGEIDLREEAVGLGQLLEGAPRSVAGQAAEKSLVLEVAAPPEDLTVTLDPTLAEQMLTNLLANAVKFSPPGGRVVLRALRAAAGGLAVEVLDGGPGISDTAIANLAAVRSSVGQTTRTPSGGTGLGLPLVKLLVERHGGRLSLARRPCAGTRATLHFPAFRIVEQGTPADADRSPLDGRVYRQA